MRSRYLLAIFAFLCFAVIPGTSSAQTTTWNGNKINGVPASVTSFGFGGRPGFHGVPASVTSLNFGAVPNTNFPRPAHIGFDSGRQHHRHNQGLVNPFYGGTPYVPYAYPVYVIPEYDVSDIGYQRPPADESVPSPADQVRQELESLRTTVREYRDELRATRGTEPPAPKAEPVQAAESQPAANQPETVLVFKDGHHIEVSNYAIVGGTLYDLSEGRTKKVALAELDLPATVKQNDEHGVEFRVPATSN
jgi:hypothetical protein